MFAAGAGHVEIVQMLLNKGANPNDHREVRPYS